MPGKSANQIIGEVLAEKGLPLDDPQSERAWVVVRRTQLRFQPGSVGKGVDILDIPLLNAEHLRGKISKALEDPENP